MLKNNTRVVVDNGQQDKFQAEVLKKMRWGLNEDVYLIRITQGSSFGCITHARESWLTPKDEE
jgi:hypothetical protein